MVTASRNLSARDNWHQRNPSAYTYTLHRRCYCASPNDVRVEVAGGQVVAVTVLESGQPVDRQYLGDYRTIAELMAELDEAVTRRPDSLLIEYDRYLGFPKRVRIDFSYLMADEELDYTIEDVEIR